MCGNSGDDCAAKRSIKDAMLGVDVSELCVVKNLTRSDEDRTMDRVVTCNYVEPKAPDLSLFA
jgi:hypothetical protein